MIRDSHENPTPTTRAGRLAAGGLAGMVAIAAGAVLGATRGVAWGIAPLALGFGGLIWLTRADRRRRDDPQARRVAAVADALVNAALLAGVLVVANVVAFRYYDRPIDFTRERSYTLESLTRAQLKALDRPVRFTAFFGQSTRASRQAERVVALLELMKAEQPKWVTYDVVNPYAGPAEFEALRARAPAVATAGGGGVVVEYGEGAKAQRRVVRNGELFAAADGPGSSFRGEDALTTAVARLREGRRPRVAYIIGHGEPSTAEADPGRPGNGLLRARLEAVGAEVVPVNLVTAALSRAETLAIVAGPKTPWQPIEVERLRKYVEGGGKALLLLDGRVATGLEPWLKSQRIVVQAEPIRDESANLRGNPTVPAAPIAAEPAHPITRPLTGQVAFLPGPTAITTPDAADADQGDPTASPAFFLLSGPESFATAGPGPGGPGPRPGPLVVGASVAGIPRPGKAPGPEDGRLVVFACPSMADNLILGVSPTNLDLLTNAVGWLRGRPDLLGIAPRTHRSLSIPPDPGLRRRLWLLPTILAFAALAGLGASTYMARRA